MRAVSLHGWGDPDVLSVEVVPRPVPRPGEFRVQVAACGVCGHDNLSRAGDLGAAEDAILGHEIAGVVDAVGSEDLSSWLGARVALTQRRTCGACPDCDRGADNQCRRGPGFYGDDIPGGYAEYVLADPRNAVIVPASLPLTVAAVLACGVGTGFRALQAARCLPGDVVIITGASGGVGLNAVALAAGRSLTAVAIVSDELKANTARNAGARVALVNPTLSEVRESLAALGRPRGADAVLELTGSPHFDQSIRSLRSGGTLVLVGNVEPNAPIDLPAGLVILKELAVVGSAHATRADLEQIVQLVSDGALAPPEVEVCSLDLISEVHRRLQSRRQIGKAVVVP